ncbi:DUF2147 domain-containing protein [Variovorax sp. J22G21]|uniref:DUF2147 domain-containing protein n=1 Tax=Variovorax fucosicus TaxID=3053517 RepID=UPI002578A088|nr:MULTISPECIES: DUF2147 domain-containing protein [unclassified Variovorax]MDM0038020.1 DUF2147 domain-containing protein [Variovorax sp. J22R193]MDM0062796.1 DUF2147 domain-containing protein [Variovorax sp. J22G21]
MSLPLSTPTRHRRAVASVLGTCLWLAACGAQAQAAADPRGRWITESGNLEVEIAPCGAALCGIATRVLGNRSMSPGAQPMQAVDTRPALGMKILQDFVPVAAGDAGASPTEWTGQIYNRENGKTYRCNMRVSTDGNGAGELLLHAYVGLPLFGKTQRWLRASADAPDAPDTTVRH